MALHSSNSVGQLTPALAVRLEPLERSLMPGSRHLGPAAFIDVHRVAEQAQNQESLPLTSDRPQGLTTLLHEISFVLICSAGQLMYAIYLAHAYVNQLQYISALSLDQSYIPWLIGSFSVANGVSVVLSGSLADLSDPKLITLASLVWLTLWNIIGTFTIRPDRMVLFFVARAMMGFSVGTLCSCAMSMLGRLYRPGHRKNQVFSTMSAMIPLGFAIGGLQAGALSAHLEWIYGSTAIVAALRVLIAWFSIPPNVNRQNSSYGCRPSLRDFDTIGAILAMAACGMLIFGLTQGPPTGWRPYTYAIVIAAVICFVVFIFVEKSAGRPLIDNRLWMVPGFLLLMLVYFIAYGAFVGGCLFYAVTFFLVTQQRSPLVAALYLLPIGIGGTLAAWCVSKILHLVPGHYILWTSAFAFALGPVFFIPQTEKTNYWALSFPGLFLSTFGPDLSFASISVFITSNVPRTFQGAAGSLVITAQNLSTAIFAAVASTLGQRVSKESDSSDIDLAGLRAIWWLSFAASMFAALTAVGFVRIPKSEETEHLE